MEAKKYDVIRIGAGSAMNAEKWGLRLKSPSAIRKFTVQDLTPID